MKNITPLFLLQFIADCLFFECQAQPTCYSSSALLYAAPGSVVQINGGMTLGGASLLENEGTVTIASNTNPGTFSIDGTSISQGNGTYRVEQDWVNNSSFVEQNSNVELFGNNQQYISGSVMTTYHNLNLTGTGINHKKTLQGINSGIDPTGSLYINDRELDTDTNTFFVTNPSPGCVYNNTAPGAEGFVSSLKQGTFSRQMNVATAYLFPTGSSLLVMRYRPVVITPSSNKANTFTVRMANNDASLDGYPIVNHSLSVANLNPYYYHLIRHPVGGDAADIDIYFDPAFDGLYDGMAQWNTPVRSVWNDMSPVTATTADIRKGEWSDFTQQPFILSNEKELPVVVPNIFTPDGDGVNDLFSITDAGFQSFHLEIYDRWGVKMYESYSAGESWDGTIGGQEAVAGTYYFILHAVTQKTHTDYSKNGFLMLIRNR
jgi:gliding motility-associated-like protein